MWYHWKVMSEYSVTQNCTASQDNLSICFWTSSFQVGVHIYEKICRYSKQALWGDYGYRLKTYSYIMAGDDYRENWLFLGLCRFYNVNRSFSNFTRKIFENFKEGIIVNQEVWYLLRHQWHERELNIIENNNKNIKKRIYI